MRKLQHLFLRHVRLLGIVSAFLSGLSLVLVILWWLYPEDNYERAAVVAASLAILVGVLPLRKALRSATYANENSPTFRLGSHRRQEPFSKGRTFHSEYSPGDNLSFLLETLEPNKFANVTNQEIVIEDVRGGGFFGKVIVPANKQFVIKTSLPDPWHHLWRTVNWGFKPFPAQADKLAAQAEHISTQLIHRVLPVLSGGRFYSPTSYGYTQLPTGYAQVVERIHGRGPRFDLAEDEFLAFRNAQQALLELGTKLGLEQVGQIHPDNPFGMANIWFDNKKRIWIWLDTIPAIPHNGWIWPAFYFRFHKDVRERFGQIRPTFNRIHTERFRREIEANKHLFTEEAYEQVIAYTHLYDALYAQWETVQQSQQRDISVAVRAAKAAAVEAVTKRAVYKFLTDPVFRKEKVETLRRIVRDPQYRVFYLNDKVVLQGTKRAFQEGIITKEELRRAWQIVEADETNSRGGRRQKIVLASLQAYYWVSAQIINAIEASTYLSAVFIEDKVSTIALGFFIGWILPSILRPVSTLVVGALTKTELKTAAKVSALPKVGGYLAVPAQIVVTVGSKSQLIWHYSVRNIIASISKVSPSGGWGTQLEGKLWRKLGKKLELVSYSKHYNR